MLIKRGEGINSVLSGSSDDVRNADESEDRPAKVCLRYLLFSSLESNTNGLLLYLPGQLGILCFHLFRH